MLAWIDLEMTGLDPSTEVIVEIAVLITDDDLEIVAEGPDLVVSQPAEKLGGMADVVRRMHASSGLTVAVEASTTSLEEAGRQVLDFLRQHIPEAGTVPLCGNSIGTDRRFLAAYLPELDRFFHYRSIDVSTVKELCRRWYPDAYGAAPAKASAHRALDDIRESVKELAYYRDTIFGPRQIDSAAGFVIDPAAGPGSGSVGGPAAAPVTSPASDLTVGPAISPATILAGDSATSPAAQDPAAGSTSAPAAGSA